MMGKINNGGSIAGCIDYVTRKKKDRPDGSPCNEWRIIDSKDVLSLEDRREIIASFEDNISLNPKVSNPVGHISLKFHELDKDKVNDEIMVKIAGKYMKRMGIKNTPYILVRHLDKAYSHCHLVYSRIDNSGKTFPTSMIIAAIVTLVLISLKIMGYIFPKGRSIRMSTNFGVRKESGMRFSISSMEDGKTKA